MATAWLQSCSRLSTVLDPCMAVPVTTAMPRKRTATMVKMRTRRPRSWNDRRRLPVLESDVERCIVILLLPVAVPTPVIGQPGWDRSRRLAPEPLGPEGVPKEVGDVRHIWRLSTFGGSGCDPAGVG